MHAWNNIPARDMSEVKYLNKEAGFHFFDKATMRFFRSRIESRLSKKNRFITSEQAPGGQRRYTVREYCPKTHNIKTLSKFQEFLFKEDASYFMKYQEFTEDTSGLGLPGSMGIDARFPVQVRCA